MSPAEKRMAAAAAKIKAADAKAAQAAKPAIKKAVKKAIDANPAKAPAVKKIVKKADKPAPANVVTLKQLCAELKIEPRLARRRLRNAKLDSHGARDRWSWAAGSKQLDQIRDLIKG